VLDDVQEMGHCLVLVDSVPDGALEVVPTSQENGVGDVGTELLHRSVDPTIEFMKISY